MLCLLQQPTSDYIFLNYLFKYCQRIYNAFIKRNTFDACCWRRIHGMLYQVRYAQLAQTISYVSNISIKLNTGYTSLLAHFSYKRYTTLTVASHAAFSCTYSTFYMYIGGGLQAPFDLPEAEVNWLLDILLRFSSVEFCRIFHCRVCKSCQLLLFFIAQLFFGGVLCANSAMQVYYLIGIFCYL